MPCQFIKGFAMKKFVLADFLSVRNIFVHAYVAVWRFSKTGGGW
jgi:hypothetical protein